MRKDIKPYQKECFGVLRTGAACKETQIMRLTRIAGGDLE